MSFRSNTSGLKSASAVISAVGAKVCAIELISNGTNAATLIVYNAQSAVSGSEVLSLSIAASTVAPQIYPLNCPVICNAGIYAAVTGTGANYIVHYQLGD